MPRTLDISLSDEEFRAIRRAGDDPRAFVAEAVQRRLAEYREEKGLDEQYRDKRGNDAETAAAAGTLDPSMTPAGTTEPNRGVVDPGAGKDADVPATEAAARKADELGVPLADVKGHGKDGRVTVADVAKAAEKS